MERQVRVSVIMGVYNGEKTLNAAIQSIVDQTMTDWELIICNDCSTDRTGELLREWMGREPRIRCLENASNMRLAASLNRCIEAAEGKYIARMDDDDISYPERLWLEADFLDRHPEYGFVSGQIDGFDGKRLIPDYWHRKEKPEKKDFLSGSQFVHPAVMFRRECLEKMGGYRTGKSTRRMEDYDLFMRLYASGYKGYNIQKPLMRYTISTEKDKYRFRIDEAKVRWQGYCRLGLMPWGAVWALRPLLVGLIPKRLLLALKTRKG